MAGGVGLSAEMADTILGMERSVVVSQTHNLIDWILGDLEERIEAAADDGYDFVVVPDVMYRLIVTKAKMYRWDTNVMIPGMPDRNNVIMVGDITSNTVVLPQAFRLSIPEGKRVLRLT